MKVRSLFLTCFLVVGLAGELKGQNSITFDTRDDYYFRVLQVSGISDDLASYNLRPYRINNTIDKDHPWSHLYKTKKIPNYTNYECARIDLFEPVLFQSYNSALPRGTNDGPIWQGKGYNVAFTIGTEASVGPLYIRFRPIVGITENIDFDLGPYSTISVTKGIYRGTTLSKYAYRDFRGSIDNVQRYGNNTYSWYDWGDSSIELKYAGFRLAYSNRQLWTGPAVNTSLQYGYSAPGFRHLYAGTYKPLETPAGAFEFAYIFGGMRESNYYTVDRVVGQQSVNSLVFIYRPWFANHFSVGAIRTFFHQYPDSFSEYKRQATKLFQSGLKGNLATEENPSGFSPDNQMGSIFFRYYIPDHGFEVYWEFGRNDHNRDWRDLRAQPNHHRAYSLGVTKTMHLTGNRLLAMNFEMNQLEASRTALTRGGGHLGGWYTHSNQIMGFTNEGQIPGTGYGPGVNMQMVKGDLYDERGSIGFKIARIIYHNSRLDQFFEEIQEENTESVERWEVRNSELMIGAEIGMFLPKNIELSASLEQSLILNQYYLKGNDIANTRFELVVRKQIDGWLR